MRGKTEQRIDETKRKISIKMIVLKTLIIALNANGQNTPLEIQRLSD